VRLKDQKLMVVHEPYPRRSGTASVSPGTFYEDWHRSPSEHAVLHQPVEATLEARFCQDVAMCDHFYGLPGEHKLVVPSCELEEKPTGPLVLAPIPSDLAPQEVGSAAQMPLWRPCAQEELAPMDVDNVAEGEDKDTRCNQATVMP